MKKILLFLTILFGSSFLSPLTVKAAQFYEAEYIPDVFVVRKQGNVKNYAQGRVLRNKETDEIVYCLQPFSLFDGNALYESVERIEGMTDTQIEQIKEVASFAYPLGSSNLVYYMATQLRIWQILEPDCEFYFTDTLNGNQTSKYDTWFGIISDNIRVYNQAPRYAKPYYTTVHGSIQFELPTSGTYQDTLETALPFQQKNNKITFQNLEEGDYQIQIRRRFKTHTNQPALFYFSRTSQAVMNRGSTEDKVFSFPIHVIDTSINVKKTDKETQSSTPSGEASLKGAVFSVYNSEHEKIATFTLDDTLEQTISVSSGTIDYLPFGTYTIQEEKAGTGYLLNPQVFEITIDENHPHIELLLENEVIKNKVTLKKLFGNQHLLKAEAGVVFEIYQKDNQLYKCVETNEDGTVTFELPYGTYRIHQKTSKSGYQKVDDFEITVQEEEKEHNYILYDEEEPHVEIEVPNTRADKPFQLSYLIGVLLLYDAQKKIRF